MPQSDDRATAVVRKRAEKPAVPPVGPGVTHDVRLVSRVGIEPAVQPDLPLAIEDYALIGDCTTAALVGRNGSIDWLCWPRFDSSACFAALLGTSENGRWRICPADPAPRVSRAYRDGTMVLETVFETADGSVALIDFMPIGGANSSVVRLVEGRRGKVAMRLHLTLRFDYGATIPWVTQLEDNFGVKTETERSAIVYDGFDRISSAVTKTHTVTTGTDVTTTADRENVRYNDLGDVSHYKESVVSTASPNLTETTDWQGKDYSVLGRLKSSVQVLTRAGTDPDGSVLNTSRTTNVSLWASRAPPSHHLTEASRHSSARRARLDGTNNTNTAATSHSGPSARSRASCSADTPTRATIPLVGARSGTANGMSPANSAMPAEISSALGLTEPASSKTVGVIATRMPATITRLRDQRTAAYSAQVSIAATIAAVISRAAIRPPQLGSSRSGMPTRA